jgi:putative phosphonate metabolism protein
MSSGSHSEKLDDKGKTARMPVRYAIYFVPSQDCVLGRFGAAMLGYDCREACSVDRLSLPELVPEEITRATAEPARYGFHATIKAPFLLAEGRSVDELAEALAKFARGQKPTKLSRLAVAPLGAFFALRPLVPPPALDSLAADCVQTLDEFRAPLTETDRARRLSGDLSERQRELLERWGYPYVLDEFCFHLTLAGPIPESRRDAWRTAVEAAFAPLAREPVVIDALTLMQQDDPQGRFRVVHRAPLGR